MVFLKSNERAFKNHIPIQVTTVRTQKRPLIASIMTGGYVSAVYQ